MKTAHARTNNKALQFEVLIRNGIATRGVTEVAREMGVHHSQISRMQAGENSFVSRAARLLAVIGFDDCEDTIIIKGGQTALVAKALVSMLEHIKSEAPTAGTDEASECKNV